MDDFYKKVDDLLKSLLSVKTGASKDLMVPAIKPPSFKTPKPSIKQPGIPKIPSGLPPPSKKDPAKVAQQLKNPQPGKASVEVLKVEDNGQWSLSKTDVPPTPTKVEGKVSAPRLERRKISRQPVDATEGFANHHSPEQTKLIHGLDFHNSKPMRGSVAGAAHRATNPLIGKDVLLKRANAHANQKERGHLENGFNSAKREVLFHNMARDYFGMGKHVPATAGFSRNGEDFSAQEMQDSATHADLKKNPADQLDGAAEGENPFEQPKKMGEFADPSHAETLKSLHGSGDLHKMALMDNIMGYHDRHAGNYMMDKGNKLHLIDNGTSFDYGNFDQTHYPDYLEHAEDPNIKGMGLDNTQAHPEAVKWLNSLDPAKAKEMLAAHGHSEDSPATQGFLRRLQGMKNSLNNGPEHYKSLDNALDTNRLTTGPLYPHKSKEPKW
jgi:hypothetical protein